MVKRIGGQTTEQTIKTLKEVWKTHPIPEILKIDNDSAFGANLPHEKYIGKLAFFLLNLGVYPLYIAPRSPWNNGQVEGFNSVFSKKFWNKRIHSKKYGKSIPRVETTVQSYTKLPKPECQLPLIT